MGVPRANTTEASGSGLTGPAAGANGDISIKVKDQYGHPNVFATPVIEAKLTDPLGDQRTLTVAQSAPDEYSSSYMVTYTGGYRLEITFDGTPISGSPYTPIVTQAAMDGAQSYPTATPPTSTVAGVQFSVVIQGVDIYGNLMTASGGNVVAAQLSRDENDDGVTVIDVRDGTYRVTVTATSTSAPYSLDVTVGGVHVIGSPFRFDVTPGTFFFFHKCMQ